MMLCKEHLGRVPDSLKDVWLEGFWAAGPGTLAGSCTVPSWRSGLSWGRSRPVLRGSGWLYYLGG